MKKKKAENPKHIFEEIPHKAFPLWPLIELAHNFNSTLHTTGTICNLLTKSFHFFSKPEFMKIFMKEISNRAVIQATGDKITIGKNIGKAFEFLTVKFMGTGILKKILKNPLIILL